MPAPSAYGQQGQLGQANQAFSQALDPNSSFSSPLYQNALQSTLNPFIRSFQQNINPMAQNFNDQINSTLRNFNQNALSGIRDQAVGVGQVGSSREGIAQGIAGQDLADSVRGIGNNLTNAYSGLTNGFMDQLGNISSQYANNAFNQGINQRLGALGMTPQLTSANFLPSQYLQDIGAQRQGLANQYLQAPITFGSQLQQLLGPAVTLQEAQSRGVSQRGVSEGFSDIFGGGGGSMMGGGGGSFFSDRRLKKNIKQIGKIKDLPLYLFEYLWGQWSIGVMADEVRDKYPEYVKTVNGFDMVDYEVIA